MVLILYTLVWSLRCFLRVGNERFEWFLLPPPFKSRDRKLANRLSFLLHYFSTIPCFPLGPLYLSGSREDCTDNFWCWELPFAWTHCPGGPRVVETHHHAVQNQSFHNVYSHTTVPLTNCGTSSPRVRLYTYMLRIRNPDSKTNLQSVEKLDNLRELSSGVWNAKQKVDIHMAEPPGCRVLTGTTNWLTLSHRAGPKFFPGGRDIEDVFESSRESAGQPHGFPDELYFINNKLKLLDQVILECNYREMDGAPEWWLNPLLATAASGQSAGHPSWGLTLSTWCSVKSLPTVNATQRRFQGMCRHSEITPRPPCA